jgi:hypothetical protein
MKHIFYLGGIFFLIYEMGWLVSPVDKAKDAYKLYQLKKQNQGLKWDNSSQEYRDAVKSKLFLFPIFLWMLLGLFTFQWPVFILFIAFQIIVITPLNTLTRYSTAYVVIHWINSLIGFVFAAFVVLNAYHLNIDTWQFIKGIFNYGE